MKSREQISSLLTLKKVLEGYDSENASSAMAKNVLKPPFHTAGPISRKVARARSKKTSSHQTSRWNIFSPEYWACVTPFLLRCFSGMRYRLITLAGNMNLADTGFST